jgi:hypothetical protein
MGKIRGRNKCAERDEEWARKVYKKAGGKAGFKSSSVTELG